MGLVVCSNSAPRLEHGRELSPRSPGGLVPLLVSLLEEQGGDWLCTAPVDDPWLGGRPMHLAGGVRIRPVRLPAPVLEQHYLAIGVRVMLWLFHYLFDTTREPVFDAGFDRAWSDYERVNQAYAEQLTGLPGDGDDHWLINDYHLFLVPEMISRAHARRPRRLTYVHGLPWCEPQYYGILPPPVRDRILASLLQCDVLNFHDSRWAAAFARCCARFLPGCHVEERHVVYRDRLTRLVVAPFPLDTDVLGRLVLEPRGSEWRERLEEIRSGRRMLARADRLDLWKNQLRGLLAYRSLLEADPGLARRWWFCAVTTEPTRTTERSRDYRDRCHTLVTELNDRFAVAGRPAVSLVYPDAAGSRHCAATALSMADVTLVNPTIDGMNLVAKEALFLAADAPLLLSVNAGAFEQLAPHVTPVEPFDVVGTAATLRDAMAGTSLPRRALARSDMTRLLTGSGPAGWLAELSAAHETKGMP